MSFSGEVKEELLKQCAAEIKGIYAELAAIILFSDEFCERTTEAGILSEKGERKVALRAENDFVCQKAFTLCKKNINIKVDTQKNVIIIPPDFSMEKLNPYREDVLKESPCKRAFLRGSYLCAGSMSAPEKSYHLEYDCLRKETAELIQRLIADFEIEAKIARRKKYYVVYIKDGSAICDLLNIMGAHVSLMNFENFRIVKEVRNSVNRKVNCETANITKTVNAASRQVQDIMLIQNTCGFADLPVNLQEIAQLRLEYQDASLQELGNMLNPPVGKSGVNHRLRRLGDIAEEIRKQ